MSTTEIDPVAVAPADLSPADIDRRVYDLYDEYCHGHIDRREFLKRCGAITVAGVSGLAMAQALMPRYAEAAQVNFNDERIVPEYVEYDSPGGTSGRMRGYLVKPAGDGPFPAVLVIHENRGLNPYIEDVARRFALAGFVALAPDGLFPVGGYPGNDDAGRELQKGLDQDELKTDMLNSARFLKGHEASTGRLGATGFCWGGGTVNWLATEMGADLAAGVPFYGAAADAEAVPAIEAALLIQFAEDDERINSMWPEFEAALEEHDVSHEAHFYPGTRHGFHNDSTPRFSPEQAEIAERRMMDFFAERLG